MARAADGISAGDVLNKKVRAGQNWSLAPAAALMSCVYPSTFVRGSFQPFGLYPGEPAFSRCGGGRARGRGGAGGPLAPPSPAPTPPLPPFFSFTAFLGNLSSAGKQRRLLADVGSRLAAAGAAHADRTALRADVVPALRAVTTAPFARAGGAATPATADAAAAAVRGAGLTKDDFDFLVDVTKFKTKSVWCADPYKGVPAAVKSAFTRALTKGAPAPRWNKDDAGFVRKAKGKKVAAAPAPKKKKRAAPDDEGDEGGEGGDASASDDDDDDGDEALPPDVAAERAAKRLKASGIVFEAGAGKAKPKPKPKPKGKGKGTGAA